MSGDTESSRDLPMKANVLSSETLNLDTGQTLYRAVVQVRPNIFHEVWLVQNGAGGFNIAVIPTST